MAAPTSIAPALGLASVPKQGGEAFLACPRWRDAIVLTAATAKKIAVPTFTDVSGATKRANFVVFSANNPFYVDYLGSSDGDVITNGAFASDTAWTKGTGWTIAVGVGTSDASQAGNSDLTQSVANLVAGQPYRFIFTVTAFTAGNVRPLIGGTTGTNRASAATFTETLIAGSSDLLVGLRADLDFAGSVDNLSVERIASVPGADITTGTAPEYSPTQRYIGDDVSYLSFYAAANTIITLSYFKT